MREEEIDTTRIVKEMLANGYRQRVKMIKRNQTQLELLLGLVVGKDTRERAKMELKELSSERKITALYAEMNLEQEMLLQQIPALQVQSTKVCRRKLFMFLEAQEGKKLMLLKTTSLSVKVNPNQKLITDQSVKVEITGLSETRSDLSVVVEIIVMTVQVQEIRVGGRKEIPVLIEATVTVGMIMILTGVTDMVEVTAITMMMMITSGQVVVGTVGAGVDTEEERIGEVITEKTGAVEDVPEGEVVEGTE